MDALLAVLVLHEHFDFVFGFFENLEAILREANALLENPERFVQRKIAFFQLTDNRFQPRHGLFEFYRCHNMPRNL